MKVTITLQQDEKEALGLLARRERRDPRQQAALLIRHGLERRGLLFTINQWSVKTEEYKEAVLLLHKRPLTLCVPESDIEIHLEEKCLHCKGTNVNPMTGTEPCPDCAVGYQLTREGQKLIQLVRLHRRYILPGIDVLAEFADRFNVRP